VRDALLAAVEANGVQVRWNTRVEEIVVRDGAVVLHGDLAALAQHLALATRARAAQVADLDAVRFGEMLSAAHLDAVTTEIGVAGPFFYAEDYHQQYLAKNPNGYCGLGGTGVTCPVGISGV
jgi:phytoene dehydrogenase-like protein